MKPIRTIPLGDEAVRVTLVDSMDPPAHRSVLMFDECLRRFPILGVIEWTPTLTGVTLYYRAHVIRFNELARRLDKLGDHAEDIDLPPPRRLTVPVCYGGAYGPDLDEIARRCGRTTEQVVAMHSAPDYYVPMIGFAPGFPYLWGLSTELATPRRETPRISVPAGSVGIGGSQTGIYSVSTPGGWHIIGRTPVLFYDSRYPDRTRLVAGDRLRFRPIDAEELLGLEQSAAAGGQDGGVFETYQEVRQP